MSEALLVSVMVSAWRDFADHRQKSRRRRKAKLLILPQSPREKPRQQPGPAPEDWPDAA